MIDILAVALLLIVVGGIIFAPRLGEKCEQCMSRKTWTWIEWTRDVSHPNIVHSNVNKYCFKCCEFVMIDDFAVITKNNCFYKVAERHKKKHNPTEGGE